jgi:hypothetical protein
MADDNFVSFHNLYFKPPPAVLILLGVRNSRVMLCILKGPKGSFRGAMARRPISSLRGHMGCQGGWSSCILTIGSLINGQHEMEHNLAARSELPHVCLGLVPIPVALQICKNHLPLACSLPPKRAWLSTSTVISPHQLELSPRIQKLLLLPSALPPPRRLWLWTALLLALLPRREAFLLTKLITMRKSMADPAR